MCRLIVTVNRVYSQYYNREMNLHVMGRSDLTGEAPDSFASNIATPPLTQFLNERKTLSNNVF
jgi:hypothetical protein